jgi:uncharacterized protein YdcH (DUF465 family)
MKKKIKKTKTKRSPMSYPAMDAMVKLMTQVEAKQAELVNKHNELASAITAQEALTKNVVSAVVTELGKIGGTIEGHMQALSGLDLNILASAEVLRELTYQLSVLKARVATLGSTSVEFEMIKIESEELFGKMVSTAFSTVRERLELEARHRREEMEKAEQAQRSAPESQTVEEELKNAQEADRNIVTNTTGGPGSDFPAGAEIFGG